MREYKILDVYQFDGYRTLVAEAVEDVEDLMPVFGEFKLNLLNADEMELDPVLDAGFIEKMKGEEIFFAEIIDAYFDTIVESLGNPESVVGYKIVEPEAE